VEAHLCRHGIHVGGAFGVFEQPEQMPTLGIGQGAVRQLLVVSDRVMALPDH
jgi:hypothetical protein